VRWKRALQILKQDYETYTYVGTPGCVCQLDPAFSRRLGRQSLSSSITSAEILHKSHAQIQICQHAVDTHNWYFTALLTWVSLRFKHVLENVWIL